MVRRLRRAISSCLPQPIVYVAGLGNDSTGNGTRTNPWRSVSYALGKLSSGGTVYMLAGDYSPFQVNTPNVTVTASTARDAIVRGVAGSYAAAAIQAHHVTFSNFVVTDCKPPQDALASTTCVALYANSDFCVIDNLVVKDSVGTNSYGLKTGCIAVDVAHCQDVVVKNCDIYNTGFGVSIAGYRSARNQVLNNKIHDLNAIIKNTPKTYNNNDDYGGVAVGFGAVHDPAGQIVRGNTIYNCSGPSEDYGTDGGGFEIWDCSYITIEGNTLYNNENIFETGTWSGGQSCRYNKFINNICQGKTTGSTLPHSVGMLVRSAENMLIDGNTVTGVDWWSVVVFTGDVFSGVQKGLTITNNSFEQRADKIYAISSNPSGQNFMIDRNRLHSDSNVIGTDWNNVTHTALAAWRTATGFDAASSIF